MLIDIFASIQETGDAARQLLEQAAATPVVPKPTSLSVWDLIKLGGWYIMGPLALMSLVAVYVLIERVLALNNARKLDRDFRPKVRDYVHEGKLDSARNLCANSRSPIARVIEKGITRIGSRMKEVESAMEGAGRMVVSCLERCIGLLSLFAKLAPMFGFIGTIIAVIKIFYDISLTDNISIEAIAMAVNREQSILFTTYWGSLETQRLRTSPNVSAIPKGEEEYVSKIIREAPPHSIRGLEMAPRGWFMVELDYTAAEVQRLAQVSGDPNMTEIMNDPQRVPHASLARTKDPEHLGQLSDTEIKKHHKTARDEAKPFTFGIPYQRGNEAMARSLNREAVRAKQPVIHTAENVSHIKDAYRKLYSVAWDYLEAQMNRVIAQEVGSTGRTYFTHKGVYGYQVSPAGFRRRYLDPALVRAILSQENRWDSELLHGLKDMRREVSNWQINTPWPCTSWRPAPIGWSSAGAIPTCRFS